MLYCILIIMSFLFERGVSDQKIGNFIPNAEFIFQLKPIDPSSTHQFHLVMPFYQVFVEGKGVFGTTPAPLSIQGQYFNTFYKPVQEPNEPANLLEACYFFGLNREKALYQKQEIEVAYPSGRYCSVCFQNYHNYFDHIRTEGHLFLQRHNIANAYMEEIQMKLDPTFKKENSLQRQFLKEQAQNGIIIQNEAMLRLFARRR